MVPVALEPVLQRGHVADVQAEQVDFDAILMHRQLHAGHEAQARRIGSALRLGDAGEGVVVGEREGRESRLDARVDPDGRRVRTVGRRRVGVQVHVRVRVGRRAWHARVSGHGA
jgi:hypothetical protein